MTLAQRRARTAARRAVTPKSPGAKLACLPIAGARRFPARGITQHCDQRNRPGNLTREAVVLAVIAERRRLHG